MLSKWLIEYRIHGACITSRRRRKHWCGSTLTKAICNGWSTAPPSLSLSLSLSLLLCACLCVPISANIRRIDRPWELFANKTSPLFAIRSYVDDWSAHAHNRALLPVARRMTHPRSTSSSSTQSPLLSRNKNDSSCPLVFGITVQHFSRFQ